MDLKSNISGISEEQNPENWSKEQLENWFDAGNWKSGWEIVPDESMDKREMAIQYFQNRERWNKAFLFLKNNDLASLEKGRIRLEEDDLYLSVDEYMTRNEENSRFEAHRKYADIQYLVAGEEKIGVVPLGITCVAIPYDTGHDIVFLNSPENNYRVADSRRFFVFFPGDAHRPCVKTRENAMVRKVVVKVRIK